MTNIQRPLKDDCALNTFVLSLYWNAYLAYTIHVFLTIKIIQTLNVAFYLQIDVMSAVRSL